MDGLDRRRGWVLALVVVAVSAAVGLIGYNIGMSHGLSQTGTDAQLYGWHRPWGFGLLFPLLFFFMWVVLFRGLWWGWAARGGAAITIQESTVRTRCSRNGIAARTSA